MALLPSNRLHPVGSVARVPERGSLLIEVVIAAAIAITVTAGVAHLLIWSRRTAWSAGAQTTAVWLAVQKMEQLRSLDWYIDSAGMLQSDEATDLAENPTGSSGTGLRPSPGGVLDRDTTGFVDYLDARGGWCGTGTTTPAGAVFVRRWSIEPFSSDSADTLRLSVLVLPIADARDSPLRSWRSVRVQTLKTRVAQ